MKISLIPYYILALIVGLGSWVTPPADNDLGWHLLGGQWIDTHGTLPSRDFINGFNPGWHDYHWLWQLSFFQAYKLGGFEAVRFLHGIIMAGLAVVILNIVLISARARFGLGVLGASILGWIIAANMGTIRPQMFGVLLIGLSLQRLLQKSTSWELPYLSVLTILFVNVHVSWIYVPLLWMLYRGTGRHKLGIRKFAIGFLLLSASGFLSPYSFIPVGDFAVSPLLNYALIWDYMNLPPRLRELVCEFRSTFDRADSVAISVIICTILMLFHVRKSNIVKRASDWFIGSMSLAMSYGARKFAIQLSVLVLPTIARSLQRLEINLCRLIRLPLRSARTIATLTTVLLIPMALVRTLSCVPGYCSNTWVLPYLAPIHACEALAQIPLPRSESRDFSLVLTHFNFGGWCRWELDHVAPEKDIRVTTDGRTQWVPESLYDISFDIFGVVQGWEDKLRAWNPDAAVVPRYSYIEHELEIRSGEWKRVHQDLRFSAFVAVR